MKIEWKDNMDKTKKNILKQKEKDLSKRIKLMSKKYEYKSISSSLYKVKDGFFVHSLYYGEYSNTELMLVTWNYIKTYEADKLFWKIFDMEDNIIQKDSLRANGAFVMPSFKISENRFNISEKTDLEEKSCEIVEVIFQEHDDFIKSVCGNTQKFNQNILKKNDYLRKELIQMLAYIELQDYKSAKQMAQNEIRQGNRGGYQNKDKDIYQHILEYCEKKL